MKFAFPLLEQLVAQARRNTSRREYQEGPGQAVESPANLLAHQVAESHERAEYGGGDEQRPNCCHVRFHFGWTVPRCGAGDRRS